MGELRQFLNKSTFDSNRQKVGLTVYYFLTYAGEDDVTSSDVKDLFHMNGISMSRSVITGHMLNLKEEGLLTDIEREHHRGYILTPDGIKKFERLAGERTTTRPIENEADIELDEALVNGETERIEFKEKIPTSKRKIPKEAVALANKRGGILVYGIDDNDNSVVGIPNIDDAEELVENLLREKVQPKMNFSIEKLTRNNEDVLLVRIPSAEDLPRNLDGIYYTRIGTSVRKLSSSELREWYIED